MTTIVTKWVDRGSITYYTTITGSATTAFGTISNTQNGSRDLNIDSLYSGADIISLSHNTASGGNLTFSLTGTRANNGWATMSIGGTSFSRSSATYTTGNGNTYWTWSLSATPFGSSNGTDKEIIWDDGGTSVNAPIASSVIITGGTSAQENTTATVNLSNTGSGGTLEYACEVGDTTPDNWQSSNTFTISRGSGTVYARARRSSSTNSNVVNTSQAAFLTGDDSFSRTSPTITSSASSATTTIQYATAGETLAIRVDGQSTNLVTALVASSSSPQNISFSSSLPSAGNSETYRFFVRRPTSTGGDGSTFTSTDMLFTVTRAAGAPSAPTNLTFSTTGTATAASVTVTASGGGTGTLKVSADGSTWVANGTSFSNRTRGTEHTWYARVESTLNSSNYTEPHTPDYLDPATGTAANDIILSGASSHTGSISGGAAGTVYEFRSGGYTGSILATVNGNDDATCSGGAGTYYVTHYKTTGTGGSGETGRANLTTYTVTAVSKRTFTIQINYIPGETGYAPTMPFPPTVTVDVGSITGSVTSSTNPLEVSVGDDVIWKSGNGQDAVEITSLIQFTNNNDITLTTTTGVTRTLANGTNGTDVIGIEVNAGINGSVLTEYRIERVGGIAPPSGLSAGLDGAESQTEKVTLNLSTQGSGGTLEYIQRTSTSLAGAPASAWKTSNEFNQTRNTTRYYWASRNRNSGALTSRLTVTVNYLGAVTTGYSFDTASGNIGYGDGAPAISFTAAQANHTVAVFEGSTRRSAEKTNGTDYNNIATNETPPAGGSNTYNLRTYRNSTAGGHPTPTYVATDAGTIEIKRYPQTPTLGHSDNSASVESPNTTSTLTLTNTDGVSTYWFRKIEDGTAFGNYVQDSNNVVTYANQTRAANQAYDYQGRIIGGNGLVSESAVINAQQLTERYLLPNTPSTPNISNDYNTASHLFNITSMPTTVYYEVRTGGYTGTQRGTATTGGGGSTKNITVTQINTGGDTVTYYVRGYRLATAGGDEHWDNLGTYTVTEAGNTAASAFTFNPNSPVGVGLSQISNLITIAGLSPGTSANFSITGGTYSKNGAAYLYTTGTAVNGDTFRVKHTSSSSYSTSVTTTLTVGGTSGSFVSTTGNITPAAFTFTDATGDFGTQQNAAVQITDISLATTVSRTSGAATFTVSSSATTPSSGFSGTDKSITNNQYIHIRQNCSNTYGAVLETEITAGGVSDTWSVTTNAAPSDSTPDPYSFTDATVAVSTETTTSVQIQGLSATAVAERTSGAALFAVSTSGSSAPSSSSFTDADKNITNNQYLWLKQTSSSSNSTTLSSVFSVGGISRTWNLSTVAASGGSGTYGLQIFPATGSIARLDTSDRTIRVLGLHTGTVAVGSSSTITQPGFSSSDATLGIEWQATGDHPEFYSLSSSGTSITISRSSSDSGGLSTYNLRIFRL